MNNPIKIAVDAMGGENSPLKIIKGIEIHNSDSNNVFYNIFGDQKIIEPLIKNTNLNINNYKIIHSEKLIDDFLNALGAYEEFLSTKNSKKTIAQRLRQNIKKIGLRDALITATSKKTLTDGYKYLIDSGLEEYTLEKVILNNKELFDEDLVVFIKDKINSN